MIYPFVTNGKSDFNGLWEQQNLLKSMEMSEAWRDTFYEGYVHQFQPEPIIKLSSSSFKDVLPRKISQMITKTVRISTRIVISYAMKWGIQL